MLLTQMLLKINNSMIYFNSQTIIKKMSREKVHFEQHIIYLHRQHNQNIKEVQYIIQFQITHLDKKWKKNKYYYKNFQKIVNNLKNVKKFPIKDAHSNSIISKLSRVISILKANLCKAPLKIHPKIYITTKQIFIVLNLMRISHQRPTWTQTKLN